MAKTESPPIQLQGIPFPYGVRELGATVEVLKFKGVKESEFSSWIQKNLFQNGDEKWGIIAKSKSKEEFQCLTMSFRRALRTRLRLHSGRIERVEEEVTEPEVCEFHSRSRDPVLELYS